MAGIEVIIGANTDDLDDAVRRSRSRLSGLGDEMKGNIATAAKWGAAVSVAATAATAAIVAGSLKSIDALAKTSDKLGIAISDLQALRQAAELTGVGTNTLDMSLQRMTRRLSEAAQGTGEAQDALKELNLDASALAKLSPDEQFREIAGAMKQVGSQSDRVRLAFKLFDSEGAALVNTLALGKSGLQEIGDEMDALGASITRVDAAKVEAANDAMLRVATAAGAVSDRLTIELASSITAVANQMVAEFSRGSGSLGTGMEDAVDVGVEALADFLDGAATVTDFISGNPIMAQFGILGWVVLGPRGLLIGAAIGATFDIIKEGLAEFGVGISEGEENARRLLNIQEQIANQQQIIAKAGDVGQPSDSPFITAAEAEIKSLRAIEAQLKETVEGSSEAQDSYNELLNRGTDKANGFAGSLRRTAEALREAREEAAKGLGDALGEESSDGRGTNTPGAPEDESITDTERDKLEKRLKFIREANMSERELTLEKFALENEDLNTALENELITKQEWAALSVEQKQREEDALTEIEDRAAAERTKIKEQEARNKAAAERQFWSDATSLMNSGSRKMFEIGKAASIAQAVVKGYSAAVSAWEAGMSTGGPYAPAVAAAYTAASLAKTAGQISAIRSASFGGGGGGSGGGGGGGSVTQGINNQSEPVQPPTETMVANLNIQGQNFDRRTVIGLVEQINDLQEDGMRIRLNTV